MYLNYLFRRPSVVIPASEKHTASVGPTLGDRTSSLIVFQLIFLHGLGDVGYESTRYIRLRETLGQPYCPQ